MGQSNFDFSAVFRQRTKSFALRVMKMTDQLPPSPAGRTVGNQLVRVSSSVAANYRAVCRARSGREFAAKLHIALEEADEAVFWLEMADEGSLVGVGRLTELLREANEILAVLGTAEKTARERNQRDR